ncbi:MAG: hypothetical protein ABIO49_01050 [Dokdonella sp.]
MQMKTRVTALASLMLLAVTMDAAAVNITLGPSNARCVGMTTAQDESDGANKGCMVGHPNVSSHREEYSEDAEAAANAEVDTDLNDIPGASVRHVNVNAQAVGDSAGDQGMYSSSAEAYSGADIADGRQHWTLHVNPSPGETFGAQVGVTISATVDGSLDAATSATSESSWDVQVVQNGQTLNVMSGTANGSGSYSDNGQVILAVNLGDTFDLSFAYSAGVRGHRMGSHANADVTHSTITIDASGADLIFRNGFD